MTTGKVKKELAEPSSPSASDGPCGVAAVAEWSAEVGRKGGCNEEDELDFCDDDGAPLTGGCVQTV